MGVVTGIKDPDKRGRVKVKIPRISDSEELNWARVCSFNAGKDRGAFFLPAKGDEVLVAFEYGDINSPIIIGSLWNGKDKPPESNSDGNNNVRVIKSRSGHIVKMDDSKGKEKIEIEDGSGETSIVFDTAKKKITIKSGKDIELNAQQGKVIIDAKEIEFKSSGDAKIDSKGSLTLKGSTIDLN